MSAPSGLRPALDEIVLAGPRGFCAGVERAIEVVERALDVVGGPIYVRREIVHNRHVVEALREKGAIFVEELDEVPAGATVIFSAHGISPAVRDDARARGLRVIDATCPLVTKVHVEAQRYAREGYTIVLVGHEDHDEVIGTTGEAPERIVVIDSVEEAERLEVENPEKVAYLTQTTLSVDDTRAIIEVLRRRFPAIVGPSKDDICYATQNRQEAVKELVPQADIVLVLGSQNSSNSMRLAELATACGKPAYLIDGRQEIRDEWFTGDETVLITAGASAPEEVVEECVAYLRDRYGATVESRTVREEHVSFPLPRELRVLVSSRG